MKSPRFSFPQLLLVAFLLIGLLLVTAPGCNYMLLLGYLIGGPPQEEPQFEKETKKSMTDKDVRVAVVCYAPDDLKYKFENIDHILAKAVAVQLANSDLKRWSPLASGSTVSPFTGSTMSALVVVAVFAVLAKAGAEPAETRNAAPTRAASFEMVRTAKFITDPVPDFGTHCCWCAARLVEHV